MIDSSFQKIFLLTKSISKTSCEDKLNDIFLVHKDFSHF